MCPTPRHWVRLCGVWQTHLPQPQRCLTRAGGCSRGVFSCCLPVGCPSAEASAAASRCLPAAGAHRPVREAPVPRESSHPWEQGGDSQGEGTEFEADPHVSCRLPDFLGRRAAPKRVGAQSCCCAGKGYIGCPTVGKSACSGCLPPAITGMPGCPARPGVPPSPPCARLCLLRPAGVTWQSPGSTCPRHQQLLSQTPPFTIPFHSNFAPWKQLKESLYPSPPSDKWAAVDYFTGN